MSIPQFALLVAAALVSVGAFGVLTRKSVILILICVELMLGGANIAFIVFARLCDLNQDIMAGHVFVLFSMAVAAAEAAVGIAIIVTIYRSRGRVVVDEPRELKG